jgi:hypothetical protein
MITPASKLFFGASIVAMLSAWVYGWGAGAGLNGVLTFGLKGSVGEVAGYTILVAVSVVLFLIGCATSILRDADPEQQAAVARLDAAPAVIAPRGPAYWPTAGALCVVVVLIGLVASPVLFVIGALGALVVTLEWMVQAWSERATGDPEVNRQIRNRLLYPIEIPIAGAVGVLVLVTAFSRVFLSLDRISTSVAAICIGALILGLAFAIAYRPHISKDAVAGLLVVGALVVITAGIVAAAVGTREFEEHDEEHEETESTDEGAAPSGAITTIELSEFAQ